MSHPCPFCMRQQERPLPVRLLEWTCPDCGTAWPASQGLRPRTWVVRRLLEIAHRPSRAETAVRELLDAALRPEVHVELADFAAQPRGTPARTWFLAGAVPLACAPLVYLLGPPVLVALLGSQRTAEDVAITIVAGLVTVGGALMPVGFLTALLSGGSFGLQGTARIVLALADPPHPEQAGALAAHWVSGRFSRELVETRLLEVLPMVGPDEVRSLPPSEVEALLTLLLPGQLKRIRGAVPWQLVQAALVAAQHGFLYEALPALDGLARHDWEQVGGPATLRTDAACAAEAIREHLRSAQDPRSLLRATTCPDADPATLLRPAGSDDTPPEQLLRPGPPA